ncbi:MAG TPA: hypothetical protein VGI54_07470 [Solirubrobacteraceae bacterium]
MADQLHAGTQVFAAPAEDTMAAAIERELIALMTGAPDHLTGPPTDDTKEARQRRLLFAAIARGVVSHFKAHPEALEVVFTGVPAGLGTGDFAAHVQLDVKDVT